MTPATAIVESSAPIEYPSLLKRVQSTFVDMLFILIMMFVITAVLENFEQVPDWVRIVLFFGIWGIYEPVCMVLGSTIGNYIVGIRVRQYTDTNRRINLFQAFGRYVLKMLLGWLAFIAIHFNKERRALHDLAVKSVMIRKQS